MTEDQNAAQPTEPAEPTDVLHAAIMNLPLPHGWDEAIDGKLSPTERRTYKIGHRDARHAAAELVAACGATAGAARSNETNPVSAPSPPVAQTEAEQFARGYAEALCVQARLEAGLPADAEYLSRIRKALDTPAPGEAQPTESAEPPMWTPEMFVKLDQLVAQLDAPVAQQSVQAQDERERFEARFPRPAAVLLKGDDYAVREGWENSYAAERFCGQWAGWQARAALAAVAQPASIDMVLHCPKCGMQHVDAPEKASEREPVLYADAWTNPPHRSHLCHGCGHIWRPADVPTNGVQAVKTTGKADSPTVAQPAQDAPIFRGGHWCHGQGFISRNGNRMLRADFDPQPAPAVRERMLDWICAALSAADQGEALAAQPAPIAAPERDASLLSAGMWMDGGLDLDVPIAAPIISEPMIVAGLQAACFHDTAQSRKDLTKAFAAMVAAAPTPIAPESADAARMDWLERHFTRITGVYVAGDHTVSPFAVDCEEDTFRDHKNRIRQAIDAAMTAKPPTQGEQTP